jgi:hypothetical protein
LKYLLTALVVEVDSQVAGALELLAVLEDLPQLSIL